MHHGNVPRAPGIKQLPDRGDMGVSRRTVSLPRLPLSNEHFCDGRGPGLVEQLSGEARGRVIQRKSADFIFQGQKFTASVDEPAFIVESDKTGSRAAHRPEALHRLNRRRH